MPYPLSMDAEQRDGGERESLASRGEEFLGALAREVLDSPLLGGVARAFEARAKVTQAQESAIGLLGMPSAADVERLTRRVRSLSDRLGGIEDALSRIEGGLRRQADQLTRRLDGIERELGAATRAIDDLEAAQADEPAVSRDQERLLGSPASPAASRGSWLS
jgi:hypothetical protein